MLEQNSRDSYGLSGSITAQSGADAIADLLALINSKQNSPRHFELDITNVTVADSTLLALIIQIARTFEARDGVFRVRGLNSSFHGLAKAYGIDDLIYRYVEHP